MKTGFDMQTSEFEKPITEETKMNGLNQLLQSRRFVVAMLDVVITLATYFVGKYYSVALDDLLVVIGALQVPLVSIIAAFTVNDMHAESLAAQQVMHQEMMQAVTEQAKYAAMHVTMTSAVAK